MSIGAGMLLPYLIGSSLCRGVERLIAVSFIGLIATVYGIGAIQGALISYKARTDTH
jgi:hypothetical protein